MSRVPTKNIDYTSKDYEAFRALLIEKLQEIMPEYTDTSETDAGIVILEALANGLDIISLYADIIANDLFLVTTQSRKTAVMLSQYLGYSPYNMTASVYPQVFILSTTRNVPTTIPKGTVVTTVADSSLDTLYYETTEDLVIPAGKLGNEKDLNDNYLYTVPLIAGQTITQDVIGSSSGSAMQSFKCSYTDVLVDSLQVYVDEGEGDVLWERVDSFLDSTANSKVYTVSVDDFDICTIQFGNGIRGKIPTAYPSGISATYRIGGGEASNVSANIITKLETGIPFVESTFNLEATTLGVDKESLESIKVNAPAFFRTRDRLVTLSDYSDLLRINFLAFEDVNTARDSEDKKLAHVYYRLRDGYTLTQELEDEIDAFIKDRSMIGTDYDLTAYTPQVVNISANLYYDKDYDSAEIIQNIEDYLDSVTFSKENLGFNDTIIKSDLENELKSTFEGIVTIRITSPSADIISPANAYNILTEGTVTITPISV